MCCLIKTGLKEPESTNGCRETRLMHVQQSDFQTRVQIFRGKAGNTPFGTLNGISNQGVVKVQLDIPRTSCSCQREHFQDNPSGKTSQRISLDLRS